MADEGREQPSPGAMEANRLTWRENLSLFLPWQAKRRFEQLRRLLASLQQRADQVERRCDLLEERAAASDLRFDAIEDGIRSLQNVLEQGVERRFEALERRLDRSAETIGEIHRETARTRDEVVPAVVDRGNLLVERLANDLDEVSSLVERIMRSEPLPIPRADAPPEGLEAALREVQPKIVETFRGSSDEIVHRLDRHLPLLRKHGPVLDLGCGRGELLLMLRDAGVHAVGIEADPALAQGARRRGLEVIEGDCLEVLMEQPPNQWGSATAIHFMEHLYPAAVLELLRQINRVLRPGGSLLIECPNPKTLRVGASDLWIDPTHLRPLMPETLGLFVKSTGMVVDRVGYLHPYPEDQLFQSGQNEVGGDADPASEVSLLARRIDRLAGRLDELINGPRDFFMVASKLDND